jgi:uncharacterized protein
MSNTEKLFRKHLETVTTNKKEWLALFDSNAVIEFPFAKRIGFPDRIEGLPKIQNYIESLPAGFEDFEFSDVKIYAHEDADSLTAEFKGFIPANGKRPEYRQTYICWFSSKEGKITHYKEYWDPTAVSEFIGGAK